MHKTLLGLAGATFGAMLMTSVSTTSAEAACGEVTITEMNWASSAVVTAVSKFIMEQGYGCSVVKVPSATLPACLLYTSPSPRDQRGSRMPSSA